MNIGEEICGEWLRYIKGCDFIQYNTATKNTQGEIDVIGLNTETKTIYACEVAIHLETGLQYTKQARPDNVERFIAKFKKDIAYVSEKFSYLFYEHVFMLWSPIVKDTKPGSKYNQLQDLEEVQRAIKEAHDIEIALVVNEKFSKALKELRAVALKEKPAMQSPVMRMLQIEEKLKHHLARQDKA